MATILNFCGNMYSYVNYKNIFSYVDVGGVMSAQSQEFFKAINSAASIPKDKITVTYTHLYLSPFIYSILARDYESFVNHGKLLIYFTGYTYVDIIVIEWLSDTAMFLYSKSDKVSVQIRVPDISTTKVPVFQRDNP